MCDLLDNANKGYHDYLRSVGMEPGPIQGGDGRAYALGQLTGGIGLAMGAGEVVSARSALGAARLGEALTFEEAASVFATTGELKPEVIAGSRLIIAGSDLKNPQLVAELTKDGSKVSDWGKYSTQTFRSPSGDFQVHYYYNKVTGATYYGTDYKAVFNHQGVW